MKKMKLVDPDRGKRTAKGVLSFLACYLTLIVLIFLMIVFNDLSGWQEYLANNVASVVSLLVCVFLLCGIIYYYYYFEDGESLLRFRNMFLIFSVFAVTLIFYYVCGKFIGIYARPFALLALLLLFLFNRRQAILLNFVFALLTFLIDIYTNNFTEAVTDFMYHSLMLGFVSGTLAVFMAAGAKTRLALLGTGLLLSIPNVVIILLLELPTVGEIGVKFLISAGWGVFGCILSAVLAIALLPLFEAIFNRLTVFRLREFTRTDAPLLRRLQTEAPGTFNHSLIVAQIAETCALALGENAELARAAAYYHDVGKLKQPECFTENQQGYNVHDELTPELSADIIRSHAKDGYDLLTSARMPEIFADVAREHHGTLPIKFFYAKAARLAGGDVNVRDYSYLGPTPRTKIAAIIMIADASEAAVRAMAERTPEAVERVVRGIIEERMDLDQFENCDITMRELTAIKQTIVSALSGVHHQRVEYPAIRFGRGGDSSAE